MLAFCICAFVSVNRFGFSLEGAWCALDRIYYDFKNGHLKESHPKWIGLTNLKIILDRFDYFEKSIKGYEKQELDKFDDNNQNGDNKKYFKLYNKISESFCRIKIS